jgi:hypothetical protein
MDENHREQNQKDDPYVNVSYASESHTRGRWTILKTNHPNPPPRTLRTLFSCACDPGSLSPITRLASISQCCLNGNGGADSWTVTGTVNALSCIDSKLVFSLPFVVAAFINGRLLGW